MSMSGQPDIESLRIAREESRSVLDHHIALQNDIDDKALKTVRLALVLVAAIISVAQLMGPDRLAEIHLMTKVSVGVAGGILGVAMFIAIGVYMETDIPYGVGESHREEVVEGGYTEREWLNVLLEEYNVWTESVRVTNELNASWVNRAQAMVAVSVGYLFASSLAIFTPFSAPTIFLSISAVVGVGLLGWYLLPTSRGGGDD